jgi:hypothetical protein
VKPPDPKPAARTEPANRGRPSIAPRGRNLPLGPSPPEDPAHHGRGTVADVLRPADRPVDSRGVLVGGDRFPGSPRQAQDLAVAIGSLAVDAGVLRAYLPR